MMERNMQKGIAFAILAAALYAVNAPFSKILLDFMPPTLMAGFLYIGAGAGMVLIALARRLRNTEGKEQGRGSHIHCGLLRSRYLQRPSGICQVVCQVVALRMMDAVDKYQPDFIYTTVPTSSLSVVRVQVQDTSATPCSA